MRLLLPVRPEAGADLGHVHVTELLQSLSGLVLVGLDIPGGHSVAVTASSGNTDHLVARLVSSEGIWAASGAPVA